MKAIGGAFIASVLIQPFVFFLLTALLMIISLAGGATMQPGDFWRLISQLITLSIYVVIVAAAFAALLGIPLFTLLKRTNRLSWFSMCAAGFLEAAVPYAVFAFPLLSDNTGFSYGANWHGTYTEFIVDGVYTVSGWLNYFENIIQFGLQGLAGGAVFYTVWLKLHEPQQGVSRDVAASPRRA